MSVTLDRCHETGAKHGSGRTSQKRLAYALPIADTAGSDYGLSPGFLQYDGESASYKPLVACTWPPASVPWQTR
jgi:hypothetical protein